MKKIRRIARNPLFVLSLSLTMLLFSCGKDTMRPSITKFSGKELMEAIYFLNGEAATLIEPLNDLRLENMFSEQQLTEVSTHISTLLDGFENAKPGRFESFKSNMTSGDHLLIGETITANARELLEYINQNEEVKAYNALLEKSDKPLASLIDEHFPEKDPNITAQEMKDVLNSDAFKADFVDYFKSLEGQLNSKINSVEQDACGTIIVGAAVLFVAAIAVLIIYAVAVLNVVELANVLEVTWQEDEDKDPPKGPAAKKGTLMREQIINSIALNWKAA